MTDRAGHVHKYKKVNIAVKANKKYFVFRCVLDCTHYTPEKFIIGKSALCHKCEKSFIIKDKDAVKPKCKDCINSRPKEIDRESIEELLKKVGAI